MGFWRRTAVYWGLVEEPERQEFEAGPVDAHIAAQVAAAQSGPAAYTAPLTREFALQVPAVLRARNIICAIATLPLRHYNVATNEAQRSPLLEQIDPDVPNVVTLAQTVEDLIFDAVSWWQVLATDPRGFPMSARHLELTRVSLDPPSTAARQALPSGVDVRSVVWVDGKPVPKSSVIRFDSPNPPLLTAAVRAIRRAALLDTTAAMYAENPRGLEYFEPAEDADPDEAEVIEFLTAWQQARRTRSTAYKPGAFNRGEIGTSSPADLQLVQLQARASLDLANAMGLDPEELGVSTTSRTYANITDRRRDRINDTLSPYMQAITSRLSMNDVTRRGYAAAFVLDDYLRADPKTRAEVQAIYLDKGVVDVAEVREDEGLPPRAEPAEPVEPAPAVPEPAAAAANRRDVIPMHRDPLMAATFSAAAPEATTEAPGRVTFSVPVARAEFKVDLEARTITGLAVPYGEVTSDWRAIAFKAGSITRLATAEPVLLSHAGMPVGVVASTSDGKAGMTASLRISKTSTGDDALVLADDGAITGLSVGVDVHKYELDTDTEVMTVTEATLREISLTPFPAFDSARITKVKMTRQESTAMSDTIAATGAADAAPAAQPEAPAVPAQFAAPAVEPPALHVNVQMPNTFAADVAAAVAAAFGEARAFVDPDRRPAGAAFVREPLPYRFDGHRGPNGHDFSTDLFATDPRRQSPNAAEAAQRLETFLRQVFADVSTGDVNELNPTRNRPDMYVAALEYSTPIWDAINKGSIGDATPFTVPQFSSSSGLVADHSESTEPTGGTFVTTSQTITPAPLSGKVEITRETIDQGGNPAVSGLIWNEIMRAWNEALEAKAVAVLEALTPTAIAITAGAADDVLAGLVEGALADLQFVAGGPRMRDLFLNKSLFRALVNAVDSTGRKLYPFLAAQNASGQVSSDFGSINVGGLVARPSWALPTSTTAEESSYLFSRSDVHGWASAPQRLNFEYEIKSVWLGVWGYAATACTRVAGVREITYDPTA